MIRYNIIFILFVLVFSFVICVAIFQKVNEPISVTTQHGFNIEVNNEIMLLARQYHNIPEDGLIWCTVNESFMFYRDGKKCYVFTLGFKEYLDTNSDLRIIGNK